MAAKVVDEREDLALTGIGAKVGLVFFRLSSGWPLLALFRLKPAPAKGTGRQTFSCQNQAETCVPECPLGRVQRHLKAYYTQVCIWSVGPGVEPPPPPHLHC